MTTVKIEGKDYETDNLSDEAKKILAKINFAKKESQLMKYKLDLAITAQKSYFLDLKKEIGLN